MEPTKGAARTMQQFDTELARCRKVFADKLADYGPSWRILRPSSLTDQIFIKAKRIRTLETTGEAMVDEGIASEYLGIVNYGIMGLIQLEMPFADTADITSDEALALYDRYASMTRKLLEAKNHDYGEAWRDMRLTSYTDFILTKIDRIKEIENNSGVTKVSEGIGSNYMDIINYAMFGMIKLSE
ncbi:MAG: DUF1599 domain-containing protein [Muribaculaceae bacterium]|nr:DUF1599 domain-containing protein [Muribaculaceae bacterium]